MPAPKERRLEHALGIGFAGEPAEDWLMVSMS
jgi:hypothetical protein